MKGQLYDSHGIDASEVILRGKGKIPRKQTFQNITKGGSCA